MADTSAVYAQGLYTLLGSAIESITPGSDYLGALLLAVPIGLKEHLCCVKHLESDLLVLAMTTVAGTAICYPFAKQAAAATTSLSRITVTTS